MKPERGGLGHSPWPEKGEKVPAHRPGWLRADRLLGEHGIRMDTAAGREEFQRRMEARRRQKSDGTEWAPVRRGWCLGSEEFRQRMLARIAGRVGENHEGGIRREAAENQAEGIIAKELKGLGWTKAELKRRHKGDPAKLALAARLRRETTLTTKWIAARLHLGNVQSARVRVHALTKSPVKRCRQAHYV